MKVLHINTMSTAGAALCAMRINNALVKEGIDSRMLFAQGTEVPEGINGAIAEEDKDFWYRNPWILRFKYLLARTPLWQKKDKEKVEMILRQKNCRLEKKLYLHGPYSSYKNIAHHPLVEWADVIHLHWVAYFVDYPTFFKKVKKPIVWTLHDRFPAVGALHFESSFYPVPDSLKSIDAYCRHIKRESVLQAQNLNIVAISEIMVGVCEKSDVLKGFPVTLIHNGVDTNTFQPYNKGTARKELGLPLDTKIFLFSANSLDDENKGLSRIIQALESLGLVNMMLLCIGKCDSEKIFSRLSFPVKVTGYVSSQMDIVKYYSAADLYLQASYIETFSQTLIEAMACGTPVVTTQSGGAKEVVHSFNGVLCKGFSSEYIALGIKQALTKDYDSTAIRQYILDNFKYEKIAKQYISLYEKACQSAASTAH